MIVTGYSSAAPTSIVAAGWDGTPIGMEACRYSTGPLAWLRRPPFALRLLPPACLCECARDAPMAAAGRASAWPRTGRANGSLQAIEQSSEVWVLQDAASLGVGARVQQVVIPPPGQSHPHVASPAGVLPRTRHPRLHLFHSRLRAAVAPSPPVRPGWRPYPPFHSASSSLDPRFYRCFALFGAPICFLRRAEFGWPEPIEQSMARCPRLP